MLWLGLNLYYAPICLYTSRINILEWVKSVVYTLIAFGRHSANADGQPCIHHIHSAMAWVPLATGLSLPGGCIPALSPLALTATLLRSTSYPNYVQNNGILQYCQRDNYDAPVHPYRARACFSARMRVTTAEKTIKAHFFNSKTQRRSHRNCSNASCVPHHNIYPHTRICPARLVLKQKQPLERFFARTYGRDGVVYALLQPNHHTGAYASAYLYVKFGDMFFFSSFNFLLQIHHIFHKDKFVLSFI